MRHARHLAVVALAAVVAVPSAAGGQGVAAGDQTATGVELFDFDEGVAGATGEIMEAEARSDRAAEAGLFRAGDLTGRPVAGASGKSIGEIGRVVRQADTVWAVLEAGGFLGLGDDEVPVELRRLGVGPGGEIVAPWLTEEALEAARDVDLEGAEDVAPDVPFVTRPE